MSRPGFALAVADRIEQVDPQEWDELCLGHPFTEHRWLRLVEAVLVGYQPRYLQLRRHGRLEAGAVCAMQRQFHLSAYLPGRALPEVAGRLLARFPPLRCGVPIAFKSGLLLRPGGDPHELVPALLRALEDLADQEQASFVGLYDLSAGDPVWLALRKAGYHVVSLLPDAYLEMTWPSFEEYQAALSGRKGRRFRWERRQAQQAGITVEVLDLSPENEPRLRQLLGNVLRRHAQPDPYRPDVLGRARTILGEDLTLLAGWQEGQIIACIALLRSGDELQLKWPGLDHSRTWDTFAYHLIMTECVPHAIRLGVRWLRCGPTSYEIKKRMGAAMEDHFLALAVRGRLRNGLLGLLLTLAGKRVAPRLWPVSAGEGAVP